MIKCFKCKINFHSLNDLILHFKKKQSEGGHDMKQNEPVQCMFNGCPRFFTNRPSFTKHFSSSHKKELLFSQNSASHNFSENVDMPSAPSIGHGTGVNASLQSGDNIQPNNENTTFIQPPSIGHTSFDTGNETKLSEDQKVMQEIISEKIINFSSLLNGIPSITASHVQLSIDHVNSILQDVTLFFIMQISSLCKFLNPEQFNIVTINMKKSFSFIENTFSKLSSHYQQIKFFKDKKLYIPPQKIDLGQVLKRRKRKRKVYCRVSRKHKFLTSFRLVPVKESSAFISIKETLSLYLSQEGVFEDIYQYVSNLPTNSEYLENITQGTWWQGNVSVGDSITLPIYVYNDDIECGNVLGSHAGVNKLNLTYLSVACLPPDKRSRLDHIFPILITKASNRKFFGNACIFKPVIDELNELIEEGVIFSISGIEKKVSFRLPLLLGDNLGLNTICGFTENFSTSMHYCRICRASKIQMRKMVVENSFLLRTEENYEADVLKQDMKTTGVKERCVWNNVDGFNIVENGSLDVMHDLMEQGVIKYVLVFILNAMIYKFRYFTLNDLNSNLSSFNFGVDMGNKPPPLGSQHLKKNKLRLSASECLCFFKYLGLLVGSYVPRNSKVWKLYFLLRNITDVLLSPVIPKSAIPLLKKLIIQHHSLYTKLSTKNLTAKFHNIIHYPRFIEIFGPPVHYSTMRWESKHRFSKSVANSVATRKNLPITVGKKCQLKVSHDAYANKFAKRIVEWGRLENNWDRSSFVENSADFISGPLPLCLQDEHMLSTTWVKIDGTKYDVGGTLLFDVDPMDKTPMFGVIEKILVNGAQEVHFLLRNYQTVSFNKHYYAFEIQILDTFSIRKSSELADFHPHTPVILSSGTFVSLPHFHTRFNPDFLRADP